MFVFKMYICKGSFFLHVFKKGYIKREKGIGRIARKNQLQKLNETELLRMRMPHSKLFIAREELLSSALTHPAIRHPSKYIYT